MLDLPQWLPLAALGCLLLSAASVRSSRWHICVVLIMVSLSYGLADTLADSSVLRIHRWLQHIAGVLGGWLLLESLLLLRWAALHPWVALILPGRWAALVYLQMQFYQTGWLELAFSMQALVYCLLIALLLSVIWFAARVLPHQVIALLMVGQWALIFIAFAALPQFSSNISIVIEEFAVALLMLGALVAVGFVCGRLRIHSVGDFWRSKL